MVGREEESKKPELHKRLWNWLLDKFGKGETDKYLEKQTNFERTFKSMKNEIKLGLPKGSLNTPGRGNTQQVLIDAGYDIQGYEPGKESDRSLSIVNDPEIIPFLTRPQSVPVELSRRLMDIAITGEDWIQEEGVSSSQNGIRRIGDLEYGRTRLVIAIPSDKTFDSLSDFFRALKGRRRPILCFTEYVNLTGQKFMQNEEYQRIFGNNTPLIQVRGFLEGANRQVQILNSDGVTEGYIAKGADIIVDNTQSGSTLREYGLRELEQIMESTAGLYAGPSCSGWKQRKAQEIFDQLRGAIVGKRYFDIKFNVPVTYVERLNNYLVQKGLCADEPTITPGVQYAAVNILIPRESFPTALRTLRRDFSASAIVRNEVKQYIE